MFEYEAPNPQMAINLIDFEGDKRRLVLDIIECANTIDHLLDNLDSAPAAQADRQLLDNVRGWIKEKAGYDIGDSNAYSLMEFCRDAQVQLKKKLPTWQTSQEHTEYPPLDSPPQSGGSSMPTSPESKPTGNGSSEKPAASSPPEPSTT